ncbi:hypothetical protein [Streptomyces sp. DH12]|uniref:hypothetical protein n=1 Tax=Streptomyces sp. DH12 TaxID=2857010 RepID=UPI001E4D0DE8|nr:hypothetical protein [Streptomyces sp. DH12]
MARVYATTAELEAYTGQPAPDNAERLLARASRLVDRAMVAAIYDVDASGYPSDPDVREGFRDAVCAQVEVWTDRETAEADGSNPAAGPWTSVSAGGLSFSRPAEAVPVPVADDTALTAEAVEILEGLGLAQVVWT